MADERLALAVPRVAARADEPPAWALGAVRGGGFGLLAYGIAGSILNGSSLAAYLDLSPLEDSIHIVFGSMMLYAGFVRPTTRVIAGTLAFIGTVSLIVGALGPTPAEELIPRSVTQHGLVDGAWQVVHHIIHIVAGVVNLALAFLIARPHESAPR